MFRSKFSSRQVEKLSQSIWSRINLRRNLSSAGSGFAHKSPKANDLQLQRSKRLQTSFTLSIFRLTQSTVIIAGDQNLTNLRISSSRGDAWAKIDRKTNNYPSKIPQERSWSRTSIQVPKERWTLKNHSSTKQDKMMGLSRKSHALRHSKYRTSRRNLNLKPLTEAKSQQAQVQRKKNHSNPIRWIRSKKWNSSV